jgi:hypothetical protein
MSLVIILNAILCAAVVIGVTAPLFWAIATQHRDEPSTAIGTRGHGRVPAPLVARAPKLVLDAT